VVLVPGLWNPALTMALLARRLAREGYAPRVFPYHGRSPLGPNVERLARFVRASVGERPAHFVGHSLGGVVVLDTLNRHPELGLGAAVLLGAPVRGCLSGQHFGRARLGRWMMGACGELWQAHDAQWRRQAPLSVVAGTAPLGLGRLVARLPAPNDGVVCVEETTVTGMTERMLVPSAHSMMILSRNVAKLVLRFLASGSFK
jgi:pimeloyl-ACP methyl ester carboxylesterase